MISRQKGFIFVHVPKTGGNSIQSVLRQYSEDQVISAHPGQDGVERFAVRNQYGLKKHSPLCAYRAALGDNEFRSLFKFACVRNPWDRMASFYFSPHRKKPWDLKAFEDLILSSKSAADYLRLDEADADPFSNVDRIIRFENLEEDFQSVCAALGIAATALPRYNRSERAHYSKYYDDRLRDLVRERFATEIERFGYTFD